MPPTIPPYNISLIAGAAIAAYILRKYWLAWNRPPSPPGPKPWPLIGNLLDVPRSRLALNFASFGDKYGPATFIRVPGSNLLIINSYDVAYELLDKRGNIYADRPRMVMMGEIIGASRGTPLRPYNPGWKLQRKYLRQALSVTGVRNNYAALLQNKWTSYVQCLFSRPEEFLSDVSRIIGEAVVAMTYGRPTDDLGNDYLELNRQLLRIIARATLGYVVDLVPALKHLPQWLPGMKFKRDGLQWRAEIDEIRRVMFTRAIKDAVELGSDAPPSYTVNALREVHDGGVELTESNEDVNAILNSGVGFFSGGAETTEYTFKAFLLAMTLFPEAQAAAHAELDRIVGRDRLPDFNDRENTPYLRAVVLEALRWSPPTPLNFPHRLMEDDVWNGYFLPKGTSVFANTWAISRDPAHFESPSDFKPERYLNQDDSSSTRVIDPRHFVFGFGRRICPGMELALHSLWMGVASTLWAFKIEPHPEDADDIRKLGDDERFTFKTISSPVPFRCRFVPRFQGAEEMVAQRCH